jgi:tRNA threonylcarbamoyladenosine biosynthesis protein TsaE
MRGCYSGFMKSNISKSLTETAELARKWLGDVAAEPISIPAASPRTSATIVGLNGNLGSGKTAFTQAVARELGVEEQITSPTFVIQKSYVIMNPTYSARFDRLVHIDAYRLEEANELEVIGFSKLANDPRNLVLIEWPERVAALLPADTRMIHFKFIDEATRSIEW